MCFNGGFEETSEVMHIRKVVTPDVFVENKCVTFDKSRALQISNAIPELAAVCIVATELELPREMELLDKAWADYAIPLLFANPRMNRDYKVWLFASLGSWQPRSVMVKHYKLWKRFRNEWSLDDFKLGPESMVESSEGIRFAGLAEVSKAGFFTATQIVRSSIACAIILSARAEISIERSIVQLFNSAFPPYKGTAQSSVDWLSLSLDCCQLGDVVIRASGPWCEREASLDFFMSPKLLPIFE